MFDANVLGTFIKADFIVLLKDRFFNSEVNCSRCALSKCWNSSVDPESMMKMTLFHVVSPKYNVTNI